MTNRVFRSRAGILYLALLLPTLCGALNAQQIRAISHPPGGLQSVIAKSQAVPGLSTAALPDKTLNATVFPGDNVIPQLVDGSGWMTSFSFANLDSKLLRFQVYFFSSAGAEMPIMVPGVGMTSAVEITLPSFETITFETPGTKADLSQGYAYIERENAGDVLGGLSVFRQRVSGRPDFEAVVPFVSEFDKRFMLLYDNTRDFVTSLAIANPSLDTITVDATIRDEDANILGTGSLTLGPLRHEAFAIPQRWAVTAGRRGIIEFRSSGWGASVLGLRFNPGGAFTSFHVLSNAAWAQPQ